MQHKICFYIRVSTEEQAKNLEGSIKNQKERLFEAVKFKNLSGNFGEVVSVFIDRAKSGKDTNRPELQKMIYEISQGNINLVMVSEISRISRNMKDFSEIWEMMKKHSCGFYSLRENFDTTTAAGEMVLYTVANIAQFERRQVSERVSANIKARAKRGLYNGGSVPLGYKLIPDKKGYLGIDEDMKNLIELSFKTFLEKETLSLTAKHLNDSGYKIRRWKQGGGKFKRLSHFTVDNLHQILTNKAYIGVKVYKDGDKQGETKAVWEKIIDEDIFYRVGKKLKQNFRRKRVHSKRRYPYILSGITYCKSCGDVMCGKSAHGNGGKIGYYEHSWATKRESTISKKTFKCSPHRVLAKKLEPVIEGQVEKLLLNKHMAKSLFDKLKDKDQSSSAASKISSLKAKTYGINSQLDALAERLGEIPVNVSATPIYKQMKLLEERKSEIESSLELLIASDIGNSYLAALGDYRSLLDQMRSMWGGADASVKDRIIKRLIHRIEVGEDSVVIHYNIDKRNIGPKTKKTSKMEVFIGSNSLTNGAQDWT